MLRRAREGYFAPSSPHELPPSFVEQAFERAGSLYRVKARRRAVSDLSFRTCAWSHERLPDRFPELTPIVGEPHVFSKESNFAKSIATD